MRLPPLNALRAFEAAARLGGIGRAAEELHVTHAAVSHQVQKLEAWFGTPLLRRDGRGVRPTRGGEELGARLTQGLAGIADACEALRRRAARPQVTVACVPSVATRWLIPRMDAFSQAHPETRIQLIHAPVNDGPHDDTADLVIRAINGAAPAGLACDHLFTGQSRPVCSPARLERHGPVCEPADLLGARLLHDEDERAWRQWFESQGLRPHPRQLDGPVFQDFNLLSTAAIAGHGVALCPVALIREDLERGDLVELFDRAANEDRNYCMLHARSLDEAGQAFREWVLDMASDTQPN